MRAAERTSPARVNDRWKYTGRIGDLRGGTRTCPDACGGADARENRCGYKERRLAEGDGCTTSWKDPGHNRSRRWMCLWQDPPPAAPSLLRAPNSLPTAHAAGLTMEAPGARLLIVVENIRSYFEGPPVNVVV